MYASPLASFSPSTWDAEFTEEDRRRAVESLERGRVLHFARLAFALESGEQVILRPEIAAARAKNISFDSGRGVLSGAAADGSVLAMLGATMARYARHARELVQAVAPAYGALLVKARTSFRPTEIADRPTSVRTDDRRLHVDAFPANPSGGRRILRVFTNVDPEGRDRVWRIGEEFEPFASRFLSHVRPPLPGLARLLEIVGVTAGRRTAYDHVMLRLHDLAKRDECYQREAPRTEVAFPSGSTWMLFSDQVLHAALCGQYVLEQTFLLPVEAQLDPSTAPIRVIERLRREGASSERAKGAS